MENTVIEEQEKWPFVLALMGPTASGKTQLALYLADMLNGEIISVDSALVYRGMDIGTAKPSVAERCAIPHHLIDILDPIESYSAGRFREEAVSRIADIVERKRFPILVGGTMLYFNTLFHGISPLPSADPLLRQALRIEGTERGWGVLHTELAHVDPVSAKRIHPNDPQRIQRALEIYRLTGVPLSTLCIKEKLAHPPFRFIKLILTSTDRQIVHQRITSRFLSMLRQGFLDEVRNLYERGDLHEDLPAIRSVGYRQIWAYYQGKYDHHTMIERAIIATRQFAKRQITWCRSMTTDFTYESEDASLLKKVACDIEEVLN